MDATPLALLELVPAAAHSATQTFFNGLLTVTHVPGDPRPGMRF
jgi:hypothetical protein